MREPFNVSESDVRAHVERVFRQFETAKRLAGSPVKLREFRDAELVHLTDVVRQALLRSRNDERALILNISAGFIATWGKCYSVRDSNAIFFCFLCLLAMSYVIRRTRFPLPARFVLKRQIMVRAFDHLTSDDFIAQLLRDFESGNRSTVGRHLMDRRDMAHVFNGIRTHVHDKFRSLDLL